MTDSEIRERPFDAHRFLGRINLHAGTPPSQFILYNHVTDYYYYGSDGHTFLPMRETLVTYLRDLGYEIIAIFNTSEGLLFADDEMAQRYLEVTTGPPRQISYGRRARGGDSAGSGTPRGGGATSGSDGSGPQTATDIIGGLGVLLRQPHHSSEQIIRAAVIIERVQNFFSIHPTPEERIILDQIQSWSLLTNDNISLLIADVERLEELPTALVGRHRSGVAQINVALATQAEINQLFISAENGWLANEFGSRRAMVPIAINKTQRNDLIGRLDDCDALTIHGYFNECTQRRISELNMRTLRIITSRTNDVWPDLLSESSLQQLSQKLSDRVLGQEYAIGRVIDRLHTVRHDLSYQVQTGLVEEKLLAYFFFAGPTGVGKTEVFRALRDAFPQVRTRKFSMTEYKEEHSVSRFFGAPPGYVGYGTGELGEFLIENPVAIVLFDEFDKAHPNIWKNFLTMLEGSLTTGNGIRVDLSQVIFIFTSNAGAADLKPIQPSMSDSEREKIRQQNRDIEQKALRKKSAPIELIGRLLESIIPFNHMTKGVIRKIIQLNLRKLTAQFHTRFHPSVEAFLVDEYNRHKNLGARVIKQHIEQALKADVVRCPQPQHVTFYKTPDGLTRYTEHPDTITHVYG